MPFLVYGLSIFIISGVSEFLLASAAETYWLIAKLILPLTVVTALVRVFFNQLTLGSYGNLKKIIQDTLKFLIVIAFTPMVFSYSIQFSDQMASKITQNTTKKNYKSIEEIQSEYNKKTNEDAGTLKSYGLFLTQNFAEVFRLAVNGITNFIAYALNYLRNIAILVLFASAPIFLYLGIMIGMDFFAKIVLSLGATLLVWPILSAILTQFSNTVFQSESEHLSTSFAQCSLLLMFSFLQLLIPILSLGSALKAASSLGQDTVHFAQLAKSKVNQLSTSDSIKGNHSPPGPSSKNSAFKYV